ncbi:signal peptidase I [Humibacillus sp. DSM 29435]|uniref:signal peptidase I n=1 Tax=Humibacillus sp. DSM 29435 TaxID=1869167 RepID=UPI0008723173|nr:signal peptidase I [Humibacillus sp. DSM 29435]OFE16654.1 signal peptidase I [Humibacillus sp. DSM 29435]
MTGPDAVQPDERTGARGPAAQGRGHRLRWLVGPAVLLLLVIVVRGFVVTPFAIPSGSMENTLLVGDRILVTRTTDPADLQRGDIIVFDATRAFHLKTVDRGVLGSLVGAVESLVGQGQETDYVKRLIGLPGDRVRCCAADGRLEVNGTPLDEPYLKPGQEPSLTRFDVTLAPDRFWVMGDNRGDSADSRSHLGDPGGGTLPGDDVIGKVWVRYWPLDRLGSPDQSPAAVPAR